jgi:hypothetical protein
MKSKLKNILLAAFGFIFAAHLLAPPLAQAAIANWQKGASVYPSWDGHFGSDEFRQSLDQLKTTNANYVSLIIPLYQSNLYSTDVFRGGNTPTDQALISGINYAHSLGLKVMLKPHLESYTHEWRANINPSDRSAWFQSYESQLKHFAQIAQDYGVEDLCLATELISMASDNVNNSNTQNWENLIAHIRGVYSGRLTYSANWGPSGFVDEKNHIGFWDKLDYIGISAYFNLYGENSVQNFKNQWSGYNNSDIKPLSDKWGKPVVFTELGYRSVSGANNQPWDYNLGGNYDPGVQSNLYEALFSFWQDQSFMQGVHVWDWKPFPWAGGEGNTDYTPQNKPAQNVITTWFGNGGSGPPMGNPDFSVSASVNPSPIQVGQSAQVSAQVKNGGAATGNIVVDMEIYNSANQKIFQQYFSDQTFTSNQSRTFNITWTPPAAGDYMLKVGIFNFNWSHNYLWADSALKLSTTSSLPPPTNSSIDVWWPTDNAEVSGLQPFKALLRGSEVDSYQMYWQVDGGGLVPMPTNLTDYPHKESLVDLSGWNWKGSGPYRLSFVAKTAQGATLSERQINIIVK